MKTLPLILIAFLSPIMMSASESPTPPLRLALIGDSTMRPGSQPAVGWGNVLHEHLKPGVEVDNAAQSGSSTKTFQAARWARALNKHPDFVFIQFGHNDSHPKERPEATDAATEYRQNLREFVISARNAGANVVLITPVRRRIFKDGTPTHELAPYSESVRLVAEELDVPMIDLDADSAALYTSLGEEASTPFTLNVLDRADRRGMDDRTHFTQYGARQIAGLVVARFPEIDPRLTAAVAP